jgi:hypothetical protein
MIVPGYTAGLLPICRLIAVAARARLNIVPRPEHASMTVSAVSAGRRQMKGWLAAVAKAQPMFVRRPAYASTTVPGANAARHPMRVTIAVAARGRRLIAQHKASVNVTEYCVTTVIAGKPMRVVARVESAAMVAGSACRTSVNVPGAPAATTGVLGPTDVVSTQKTKSVRRPRFVKVANVWPVLTGL